MVTRRLKAIPCDALARERSLKLQLSAMISQL